MEERKRKKSWNEKVSEAKSSYLRSRSSEHLSKDFYKNLFYLNPSLEKYFVDTDWKHQHIALLKALEHLFNFLEEPDSYHRNHIKRIAKTHSSKNMNIHPQHYYYWIDALILTFKDHDKGWNRDLEFYMRECLFFPVSFIISLYHH